MASTKQKPGARDAGPSSGDVLSVYDGRQRVGVLEDKGRRTVVAFLIGPKRRVKVGIFRTRTAAVRALHQARAQLYGDATIGPWAESAFSNFSTRKDLAESLEPGPAQ
jgi:hypothetical protein